MFYNKYAQAHTHAHIHTHACIPAHTYTRRHTHAHTHTHTNIHTCTYSHMHIYTYSYAQAYANATRICISFLKHFTFVQTTWSFLAVIFVVAVWLQNEARWRWYHTRTRTSNRSCRKKWRRLRPACAKESMTLSPASRLVNCSCLLNLYFIIFERKYTYTYKHTHTVVHFLSNSDFPFHLLLSHHGWGNVYRLDTNYPCTYTHARTHTLTHTRAVTFLDFYLLSICIQLGRRTMCRQIWKHSC